MVALNTKPEDMDWRRWADVLMEALIICELDLFNEQQRNKILAAKNLELQSQVKTLSEELTGGA